MIKQPQNLCNSDLAPKTGWFQSGYMSVYLWYRMQARAYMCKRKCRAALTLCREKLRGRVWQNVKQMSRAKYQVLPGFCCLNSISLLIKESWNNSLIMKCEITITLLVAIYTLLRLCNTACCIHRTWFLEVAQHQSTCFVILRQCYEYIQDMHASGLWFWGIASVSTPRVFS